MHKRLKIYNSTQATINVGKIDWLYRHYSLQSCGQKPSNYIKASFWISSTGNNNLKFNFVLDSLFIEEVHDKLIVGYESYVMILADRHFAA